MRRIVFVTALITHYRATFHERVRAKLSEADVIYDLVYSDPQGADAAKRDTVDLPWATRVPVRQWFGGRAVWQSIGPQLRGAELVVLGQENRFLHNYPLQLMPRPLRPRVALWGHGRSFQARNPDGRAERWKRHWATRADWWFAYTQETRRQVQSLGFPDDRITVFNNAVDTAELRREAAALTPARQAERRKELSLTGTNVAVYVGGLYSDKRLDFLVEAAVKVRSQIPDFELIVAGGGPDFDHVQSTCEPYPWIKVVGPRFGTDKAELMSLAQLFLMPGLLGLAILDAAVMGLPTVTTAFPWHSPEIAYLEPNVNGVQVEAWQDTEAYASAVAALLNDPARISAMAEAARATAERFTIEAMADRFTAGVLQALTV